MEPIETAAGVQAAIAEQYGSRDDLQGPAGVLHVTSVWTGPGGRLITLNIGPTTPKSDWDFFALNLARARADAIVVTGRILRHEPDLAYSLAGPAALGLRRWRVEHLGKLDPPTLAILTSGRDFDPRHPALHGWARPVLYTTPQGAARMGTVEMDVVTHDAPSLHRTIGDLRRRGAGTVSLEAGPSTTAALYDDVIGVDELMLSRFEGEHLPEGIEGGVLMTEAFLEAKLEPLCPSVVRQERSGPWSFGRFRPR